MKYFALGWWQTMAEVDCSGQIWNSKERLDASAPPVDVHADRVERNSARVAPVRGLLMEVFPGVSMDASIRFGKPCLAGTRMDIATVLAALASGQSTDEVCEDYQLTLDQVNTALRYAAHVAAHLPPAVAKAS